MAKRSMIEREKVRVKKSEKARTKREELKQIIKNQEINYDTKMEAVKKLNKRPRDESPARVQRRCVSCGRPRAVYRKFALCRLCMRGAAMRGDVPGMVKSSW